MNDIIKIVLSLVKVTILMSIFIVGYILFVSNTGVRVTITNNTNKNLHNIEVFIDRPIIHLNTLNTLNSYNIVFDNKVEITHNLPVIVKFDLGSKTYVKKIYPYIAINDSYVLYINLNKNGKIEYNGKKLLFSINILEMAKNYWYR